MENTERQSPVYYTSLLPLQSQSDSDSNFDLENTITSNILNNIASRFPHQTIGNSFYQEDEEDLTDESKPSDPFAPQCKIPIPATYNSSEYWLEPTFIRRRNERERQRVRNVNDGFERLRNHLPLEEAERERRLSKVETLRLAIGYIRQLEDILKENKQKRESSKENDGIRE